MRVYDTTTADAVENGDQILVNLDPIEVISEPIDSGDAILIVGNSYESGDRVTYILPPHQEVELWTA